MSTRSRKRIRRSLNEDAIAVDTEVVLKAKRRTSNKCLKENDDQFDATVLKPKKRKYYVTYPKDSSDAVGTDILDPRSARKLRRNILKDHNKTVPITEQSSSEDSTQVKRITRHTKKYAENILDNETTVIQNQKSKSKKNKKNKINMESTYVNGELSAVVSKKSKKKKGKRSNSINEEVKNGHVMNKSNMSTDSYYSAVASPPQTSEDDASNCIRNMIIDIHPTTFKKTKQLEDNLDLNNTVNKDKKSRRSGIMQVAPETVVKTSVSKRSNSFLDNTLVETSSSKLNATLEKDISSRKLLRKNGSIAVILQDKTGNCEPSKTFEKATTRKSLRRNGSMAEKVSDKIVETTNSTTEISNNEVIIHSHNSTYDKETKLDSTFNKTTTHKSSVISSDGTINVTYDKSDENSHMSISSDDSKAENIANSTPVIIESSMDESQIDDSTANASKSAPSLVCSPKDTKTESPNELGVAEPPATPLKREGTFTLENLYQTPKNHITLPSTPFPSTRKKSELKSLVSLPKDTKTESPNEHGVAEPPATPLKREGTFTLENPNQTPKNHITMPSTPFPSTRKKSELKSLVCLPKDTKTESPNEHGVAEPPATPLKREGTFTSENLNQTPKNLITMPSTPFPSTLKKSELNVTRSLEKVARRSLTAEAAPRHTKVMFCSPVNNQAVESQLKQKVIKSSLKGSNKSFVFDERADKSRSVARKRSLTCSEVEDVNVKRKRLPDELQLSVNRLSRPRASSTHSKLPSMPEPIASKAPTPAKSKPESKLSRTKLPNFASLHRRNFAKMESLDDFKERKAQRARQLLTPNGGVKVLQRSSRSPMGSSVELLENPEEKSYPETSKAKPAESAKRGISAKPLEVPKPEEKANITKLMETVKPGYTRFGFKLKTEFNPFTVPSKSENKVVTPKKLKREATQLSLTGVTGRKEAAKQVVMREKSFRSLSGRCDVTRKENRTIIKGVRTNRRFELQMRLRNIDG